MLAPENCGQRNSLARAQWSFQLCYRLVVLLGKHQQQSDVEIHGERKRIDFLSALQHSKCLIEPRILHQKQRVPLMRRLVAGIQLNGSFVLAFGGRAITIVMQCGPRQRCVGFGKTVVELECFNGSSSGFWKSVFGRQINPKTSNVVGISQPRISDRVIRVEINRLFEVFSRNA